MSEHEWWTPRDDLAVTVEAMRLAVEELAVRLRGYTLAQLDEASRVCDAVEREHGQVGGRRAEAFGAVRRAVADERRRRDGDDSPTE